jgi:hypothetical protein
MGITCTWKGFLVFTVKRKPNLRSTVNREQFYLAYPEICPRITRIARKKNKIIRVNSCNSWASFFFIVSGRGGSARPLTISFSKKQNENCGSIISNSNFGLELKIPKIFNPWQKKFYQVDKYIDISYYE